MRGTRLSVDFLVGLYSTGWTEQQILDNYPSLTVEGLRAALAFAAECLRDEAIYLLPAGA